MSSAKSIKENVARAKSYAQRKDYMRCLFALSTSLDGLSSSQVFGREKFEIGILIDEVFRQLLAMEELKNILPRNLKYVKGQEKKTAALLVKIHDTIKQAIEKAAVDKVRKQKNQIDQYVLAGQKAIEKKDVKEAKKLFRKISDAFPEEKGLLQDVGGRLVRGGFAKDGIDFLEKAIERVPGDSRPYISLLTAWEMLADADKALEVIKDIVRRFGANESIYVRQSKLYFQKRMYAESYDAAAAAIKLNPLNADARKISDRLGPKIFGRGYKAGQTAEDIKKSKNASASPATPKPSAKKSIKKKGSTSINLDF